MSSGSSVEPRGLSSVLSLGLVVEIALAFRIAAADLVHILTRRKGVRCLFPDTEVYWRLAGSIRSGLPYEISQWGIPHKALRTPGYPLFLAGCRLLFGDHALPVRLVQAVVGAASVVLPALLARKTIGNISINVHISKKQLGSVGVLAGFLMACDPGQVGLSVLLLSEALYVPLLLLGLLGVALVWDPQRQGKTANDVGWWSLIGLGAATGGAFGLSILVRPSGGPLLPLLLGAWLLLAGKGLRLRAIVGSAAVAAGVVLVMTPWWIRNLETFGQFVPTAAWGGASLYDGLNPRADGSSDMSFLNDPGVWQLDEIGQDHELTRRALGFVRKSPGRAAWLALLKAGRFWSPWPNAEAGIPCWARVLISILVISLYVLIIMGVWDRRRDPRTLCLLAGPLVYFALLHLVFVGSVRYRIAATPPAFVLAALGVNGVVRRGGALRRGIGAGDENGSGRPLAPKDGGLPRWVHGNAPGCVGSE